MEPPPPSSTAEEQRLAREIMSRGGGPAFVRRARNVEEQTEALIERLAALRQENLQLVRLRLGQLAALAGSWTMLQPLFRRESDLDALRSLHEALAPELRLPVEPTTSMRVLARALGEVIEAMELFNRRWARIVEQTDLSVVNQVRDGYNRYYLLEKECALGSAQIARRGFQRVEPLTLQDLLARFPLLNVPSLA